MFQFRKRVQAVKKIGNWRLGRSINIFSAVVIHFIVSLVQGYLNLPFEPRAFLTVPKFARTFLFLHLNLICVQLGYMNCGEE